MTMTDPIADMLTRIRNANTAGHPDVYKRQAQAQHPECCLKKRAALR